MRRRRRGGRRNVKVLLLKNDAFKEWKYDGIELRTHKHLNIIIGRILSRLHPWGRENKASHEMKLPRCSEATHLRWRWWRWKGARQRHSPCASHGWLGQRWKRGTRRGLGPGPRKDKSTEQRKNGYSYFKGAHVSSFWKEETREFMPICVLFKKKKKKSFWKFHLLVLWWKEGLRIVSIPDSIHFYSEICTWEWEPGVQGDVQGARTEKSLGLPLEVYVLQFA